MMSRVDDIDGRVLQLLAGLANDDARRRFAELVLGEGPVPPSPHDAAFVRAGVLQSSESGVSVDPAALKGLLASAGEAKRRGGGAARLDRLPRKAAQRATVLAGLAARVFDGETELDERELGARLAADVDDVALFRRALVDDGVVHRDASGARYWLPSAAQPD